MTLMTCAAVQRRLQAFHDRELPIQETIAVEHHVGGCPPCGRELRELQTVGDALRFAAAPGPADDWTGLQPGVISRMRAEASESWAARARRCVDDVHLVWIGLASAAATLICAGSVLSLLQFGVPGRNDSLAAVIAVMGAPGGSNLNPAPLDGRNLNGGPMRVQVPTVPQDGVVYATLENAAMSEDDLMVPLSASVTREGRVADLRMLSNGSDADGVRDLVQKLSVGRLTPAQFGGDPVAVNVVWLLAHTTVKPTKLGRAADVSMWN